ncbi:MAG: glycosyltransferase family 1 protein [Nonlabens sp.]|uniref:glycosyltransferase n=1 Tax=Nonlabens sp. TaxID=1888209 RepID=UPI003219D479
MRILLVGEYSGFHNSLKHGLEYLGHKVTILGDGDGFKRYPVDIDLSNSFFEKHWLLRKFKVAWWKMTGHNLEDRLKLFRFRESENQLKHFDIVQFINSNPFNCHPKIERKMLDFLLNHNERFFLVACGDDYEYSKYLVEKHQGYSILDAVKSGTQHKNKFYFTYKYLENHYRNNYLKLLADSEKIIPSNIDYAMALTNNPKVTEIIPAAINCGKYHLNINAQLDPIEIFMGINRANYWKKGINYFEKALAIISNKYGDQVKITIAEDLPYDVYMSRYSNAHILLDQVLCYDQGYNALEAMLQGKVVFSGGSSIYLKAHGLESVPVIDAQPDVNYLVVQLSRLIDQPQSIIELGKAARNHILQHHESVMIAEKYLKLYQS